ncbi:MAG: MBL fold metallo-hydrolase [Desulfobacteraceae bacterium]|nr:MBL fold metallo-hydrolase [Desulfobacteraceae bacterium]
MIITQPGRVADGITLLGREESCLYLVQDGGQAMILGGGMAHIVPDVMAQLMKFQINEQHITHIIILHGHFDHCGAVPFFKKRWPWAKVVASRRAAALLAKPQVMEGIARMNQLAVEGMGLAEAARQAGFWFEDLKIEATLGEGDRLRCGGLELDVMEAPGHSSCSLVLHLPAQKALFVSDALGIYYQGVHQPAPNSNFDDYQRSLEQMARYAPEVILMEHFGAVTRPETRTFISDAINATQQLRIQIEDTYRRTRDVAQCTREIAELFLQRPADAFLPEAVRATVAGQMVRFIAKSIEARMEK